MAAGHEHGQTRRSFLAKLAIGAVSLAGAGLLLKNFVLPGGRSEPHASAEFPGEDSIFHPRKDPRLEAIERRRKS